jgi:hypothetical protein
VGRGRRILLGRCIADLRRRSAPRVVELPADPRPGHLPEPSPSPAHLLYSGAARQAVVVLVHVLVRPRTSWRVMRTPAPDVQVPAPVRDRNRVANRSPGGSE